MDNQFSSSDDEDDKQSGGFSLSNIVVDELRSNLKESLKIDSNNDLKEKGKLDYYYEDVEEEEEEEDLTEALLGQMGYGKSGPIKHEPPPKPLPADNLKSAMKSNGQKREGAAAEKAVTWAEYVYDPVPTSESHYASNRTERHKNESKKSGKNRQKGGGKGAAGGGEGMMGVKGGGKDKEKKDKKRGGGGGEGAKGGKDKDKKQVKKYGASSKYAEYDAFN
ncbi:hypothetical protein ACH5RR_010178 [Cinchona calisaya]|uniref:Uncharacterized protein n=1 Tax=Cinchona calisaya TaxID=153742 RepID=A0ABD3AGD7_9GENT